MSRFFFELYKTYLIYFCKQLCCNLGKGDNETLLPTQINSQTGNFQWCFPLSAVLPFNETGFAIWLCFGWWKSSNYVCVTVCADKKEIRRDFDFHLFTSSWWSRPLFLSWSRVKMHFWSFLKKKVLVLFLFLFFLTDRPKLLLQYFMGEVWPDIYKKSQGDGEWEGLFKYELRDIFFCYGIYFDISWHKDLWLTFV